MLEHIIQDYGYLAVFIGTCLEGEGVLLLAGYFAHRGYLDLPLVLLLAFAGSFVGDQVCYIVGRIRGRTLLDRHPKWQSRADWILTQVAMHERWLLLLFRFVPGTRMLTPIVLGVAGYPQRRFLAYNAIGACAWSLILGFVGYFAGHAAVRIVDEIESHEYKVLSAILLLALAGWLVRRLWLARSERRASLQHQHNSADGSASDFSASRQQ